MNDPSSKKILFNKSTLFSLKAELLKKREEVNEKKSLPQHKVENFKPTIPKSHNEGNKKVDQKVGFKDRLNAIDAEELEASRKVRLALEKKAELYEHLADSSGNSKLGGQFLVDFDSKKQLEEKSARKQAADEQSDEEHNTVYKNEEDGDDWVDFTDCLGRTRKCHKTDWQFYMKKDKELKRTISKETDISSEEERETSPKKEMPFLVQKTNDYLQSLREKWEQKENELVGKDRDIHYQDLLFDEARIHGVGYYSFSTEETERRKQMEEMNKQRQATLKAQEEAEQVRKKRDELMEARVAAARARQRARAGLPPEEPKEKEKDFTACLLEFLTQQKNEADAAANEAEKKAKEEKEKERQQLREAHIREWDLGKDGIDGKVKKFREMSQEEYVEQQRSKRIEEFAPPQASSSKKSDFVYNDQGRRLTSNSGTAKTWDDVRPIKTPPPPDIGEVTDYGEKRNLYFSTLNAPAPPMRYKNFVKPQEPVLIENELSDDDTIEKEPKLEKRKLNSDHAEVEPPPTYDYYGPTPKQSKTEKPFNSNINEAYAQGAKSLEHKSEARKISKQYDFMFD